MITVIIYSWENMKIKSKLILQKNNLLSKKIVLSIIFLLLFSCFIPMSLSLEVENSNKNSTSVLDGRILFAPMFGTTTYLIDNNGNVNHTWPSNYIPGTSVLWIGDGSILRTIRVDAGPGGTGGGIQKSEWDGSISWDFRYNTNGVLTHHDIKTLPNGFFLWDSQG